MPVECVRLGLNPRRLPARHDQTTILLAWFWRALRFQTRVLWQENVSHPTYLWPQNQEFNTLRHKKQVANRSSLYCIHWILGQDDCASGWIAFRSIWNSKSLSGIWHQMIFSLTRLTEVLSIWPLSLNYFIPDPPSLEKGKTGSAFCQNPRIWQETEIYSTIGNIILLCQAGLGQWKHCRNKPIGLMKM